MPLNVLNSPFNQEQSDNLNRLLPTLTETQKIWLSGYLAFPQTTKSLHSDSALQNTPSVESSSQHVSQIANRVVTVLFGSETGNGQALAGQMVQTLKEHQFEVQSSSLDDFKPKDLKKVQDLLIVTSTHGEGDPPDNALSFHEFLHSKRAPRLEDLRFSVLSLGDQSYEFFCQTGKDFDKRLEELGGERLYPRVDCDLDFDEPAAEWMKGVFDVFIETKEADFAGQTSLTSQGEIGLQKEEKSVYSRTNPFRAEVVENLNLSGHGSNKETRHLELSLDGSNLKFEPGDSLGIFPENNSNLVDKLINTMNWNPEESVPINKQGEIRSLRQALLSHFEITKLTKPLLKQAADLFANNELTKILKPEREEELKAYLDGRDLLDLVMDFPPQEIQPSEFIQILRKIPARLYSIASSYKANPDEVHLTVGTVRYNAHGRDRVGVCSGQLAERVQLGDLLSIYVHHNPNFKLPADSETPVIMIGPGTGVAPFRSFLEEREAEGAKGKTWLFFGDQHFSTDFLYQIEWQRWLNKGVLTRMDVAFSRDTDEKVYVQHRMLDKSRVLYQWLEEGAHVYICGDEKHMAHDVHTTLISIIEKEGDMNREEAEAYLNAMRLQKRYQRDVY